MKLYQKYTVCCSSKYLKKYKNSYIKKWICKLCGHEFMGSPIYVLTLGIIGVVTTAYDILRIMNIKFPIKYSIHCNTSLSPLTFERDLKCMSAILGVEHYTLVLLGIMTNFPLLYTQWLLLQACIIIIEMSVLLIKIVIMGLNVKLSEIFQVSLTIFNWLQVFCLFLKQLEVETFYMTLTYFLISCLSYITLEIGARSPLGRSVTRAATFYVLFRRNYDIKIKISIENCLSAIITTVLMYIGDKWKIPHLFLPWLLNIINGIIIHEIPTLFVLLYNQLSHAILPGSVFALIATILIVEQLCIWWDVMFNFKRCWSEQKYMNLFDKNQHNINHNDENKSKSG